MLQKIYFMVFERYIPELKKYDSILFLHQPMTSGQPLKIVQRHMAHPVVIPIILLFRTQPLGNSKTNFEDHTSAHQLFQPTILCLKWSYIF